MASLPSTNLDVGERSLHWPPTHPNPDRVGSNFKALPELYFAGSENVTEFLDTSYYEMPTNLACAYLKGHLVGRVQGWFEVLGYSYVRGTTTNFAQLKESLTESFLMVRIRSELEVEFFRPTKLRIRWNHFMTVGFEAIADRPLEMSGERALHTTKAE
ncbi:uncharacterized protein TNCV_4141771 [Trichonephila clavipes]|nr:uncharacterized protein TNCV_4141771 [Trichonephila clavipes]